jgi:hypothetical protein
MITFWDIELYWIKGLAFGLEYLDMGEAEESPYDFLIHFHFGPVRISLVKYLIDEEEIEPGDDVE